MDGGFLPNAEETLGFCRKGGFWLELSCNYRPVVRYTRCNLDRQNCGSTLTDYVRLGNDTLFNEPSIGIIRGNPGVFQLYPYPTLQKPLPLMRVRVLVGQGKGFSKLMGLSNSQGYSPNLL